MQYHHQNQLKMENKQPTPIFIKVIVAILGGADAVFNIATPILLALLIINVMGFGLWYSTWNGAFLLIVGILSTIYRAIKIGFMKWNGRRLFSKNVSMDFINT